eukprot:TRINITY_DN1324_c0_g1_i3.p1 TRINITY_DN1324_c0_g1~~TRINITY_DN1324_c0_g1_i3.p1  ORF type:complete len:237 (-),score=43.90 TRINITY_DN1324_c0_g1_i3:95-805(-)
MNGEVRGSPDEEQHEELQVVDGHLSAVGRGWTSIPTAIINTFTDSSISITSLDLSYNSISKVDSLDKLLNLKNLVLDSNSLDSEQSFPPLAKLETLCVNNNQISDLDLFLKGVKPLASLSYLSMLKNPACPNYFTGKDQEDYKRYRLFVLHRVPNLKFLDSSPVSAQEKKDAERIGHLMAVARPDPAQYTRDTQNQQSMKLRILCLPRWLLKESRLPLSVSRVMFIMEDNLKAIDS